MHERDLPSNIALFDGQQTNKTPLQSTTGEMSRPNNLQRIAQKKAMVRSYPRNKKLEKLAVYSSCKVLFLDNLWREKLASLLVSLYI
jgi:hypothetical protein